MPISPQIVADTARRLDSAMADHIQVRSLSHDHPHLDLDDAYAIQHAWAAVRRTAGARLVGYKVGLTTPAVQRACNIQEPTYGHLFDDMIYPEDRAIPTARMFEPRVETELAFVLEKDLSGPDCTISDVLDATARVVPAIEIVDLRFRLKDTETGAERGTTDIVADNTSSAGVVLGRQTFRSDEIDLKWAPVMLYRDGVVEASGVSGVVMDHPANSLVWLCKALHRRGQILQAGQVVMSGSFITPFPAKAGDAFTADFGALGAVALDFE
jgi:2-oxo-hept-3-ene-1,7-dioate hydratase